VLDLFGASQSVGKTWSKAGYKALCFDIKLSQDNDIVSEVGFKGLLRGGLQCLVRLLWYIGDYWAVFGPQDLQLQDVGMLQYAATECK